VLAPGTREERRIPPPTRDLPTAALAVSHDGRIIAHAFRYGVQLYDASQGTALGPLLHADLLSSVDLIAQVAFAPNDDQILARTIHGAWLIWPIPKESRRITDLQGDADLLNALPDEPILRESSASLASSDPGAWQDPERRPMLPAAGYFQGAPIPARAPGTSPLLLDMTAGYNTAPESVFGTMHSLVPSMNLLPLGTVRIEGVDYDVRGAAQVHQSLSVPVDFFNSDVKGISVPATPIAAFHVLMLGGVFLPTPDGYEQVRLRLHYRDGSSANLPLRSGLELPGNADQEEAVPFGWVWGDHLRLIGDERQHLLSNPRLANPYPQRLVATIDLEATDKKPSSPVFFAITAETVIAARDSGIDSSATPGITVPSAHPGRNP